MNAISLLGNKECHGFLLVLTGPVRIDCRIYRATAILHRGTGNSKASLRFLQVCAVRQEILGLTTGVVGQGDAIDLDVPM